MQLPGSLGERTLGDLLGALYRERATGVLELLESRSSRCHRVHFDAGLVSAVETPAEVPRLGELLRTEGWVGWNTETWLTRELAQNPGSLSGELLVRSRLASPELIASALRHQLKWRLSALFELGQANVRFRVARPRVEPALRAPLSPREFLHGRPRGRRSRPASSPLRTAPSRRRALEVLGLAADADQRAISQAFRKLAQGCHPDRFPNADGQTRATLLARFCELSAAYHALRS